jgi:hypothetical protein
MDKLLSYGPSFVILMIGIFLLLAAIVGGGLEIKEIKIPKIDKTPRVLTAFLGLALMTCGASVGMVTFIAPMLAGTTAPPKTISPNFTPNTDYIQVNKIKLPQESGLSAQDQQLIAEFIVKADKAEILANFYQDISYVQPYYSGQALMQVQQVIDALQQSGTIELNNLDLNRSYYVNMRLDNNIIAIDECEYWRIYYYDQKTGNLVKETDWMLVPQTISMEVVSGRLYITTISFYQNNAFCNN